MGQQEIPCDFAFRADSMVTAPWSPSTALSPSQKMSFCHLVFATVKQGHVIKYEKQPDVQGKLQRGRVTGLSFNLKTEGSCTKMDGPRGNYGDRRQTEDNRRQASTFMRKPK